MLGYHSLGFQDQRSRWEDDEPTEEENEAFAQEAIECYGSWEAWQAAEDKFQQRFMPYIWARKQADRQAQENPNPDPNQPPF